MYQAKLRVAQAREAAVTACMYTFCGFRHKQLPSLDDILRMLYFGFRRQREQRQREESADSFVLETAFPTYNMPTPGLCRSGYTWPEATIKLNIALDHILRRVVSCPKICP